MINSFGPPMRQPRVRIFGPRPGYRKVLSSEELVICKGYIVDVPQEYDRDRDGPIIGNMATFPPREKIFRETFSYIVDQFDILNIYLNQYSNVPDFLNHPKVNAVLSQNALGNLGDAGKFYFSGYFPGYFFTIDDDIFYPADYVESTIKHLKRYSDQVIITYYGQRIHRYPSNDFLQNSTPYLHWLGVNNDIQVEYGGTGVMAFKSSRMPLLFIEEFKQQNMADVWISKHAARYNIPIIVANHPKGWLKNHSAHGSTAISADMAKRRTHFVKRLNNVMNDPPPIGTWESRRNDLDVISYSDYLTEKGPVTRKDVEECETAAWCSSKYIGLKQWSVGDSPLVQRIPLPPNCHAGREIDKFLKDSDSVIYIIERIGDSFDAGANAEMSEAYKLHPWCSYSYGNTFSFNYHAYKKSNGLEDCESIPDIVRKFHATGFGFQSPNVNFSPLEIVQDATEIYQGQYDLDLTLAIAHAGTPEGLDRNLKMLSRYCTERDEILIIENESEHTPSTLSVVDKFPKVRIVVGNYGPMSTVRSRKIAIDEARGKKILHIDAFTYPQGDIFSLAKTCDEDKLGYIYVAYVDSNGKNDRNPRAGLFSNIHTTRHIPQIMISAAGIAMDIELAKRLEWNTAFCGRWGQGDGFMGVLAECAGIVKQPLFGARLERIHHVSSRTRSNGTNLKRFSALRHYYNHCRYVRSRNAYE